MRLLLFERCLLRLPNGLLLDPARAAQQPREIVPRHRGVGGTRLERHRIGRQRGHRVARLGCHAEERRRGRAVRRRKDRLDDSVLFQALAAHGKLVVEQRLTGTFEVDVSDTLRGEVLLLLLLLCKLPDATLRHDCAPLSDATAYHLPEVLTVHATEVRVTGRWKHRLQDAPICQGHLLALSKLKQGAPEHVGVHALRIWAADQLRILLRSADAVEETVAGLRAGEHIIGRGRERQHTAGRFPLLPLGHGPAPSASVDVHSLQAAAAGRGTCLDPDALPVATIGLVLEVLPLRYVDDVAVLRGPPAHGRLALHRHDAVDAALVAHCVDVGRDAEGLH
mmetsp:Transcript_125419/g.362862  ORF Transcript_125419/g.362862 Transcript_125419/m.362862 type:complete len:337 (+) Transcript_125419:130-1140(+)